MMKCSPKSGSAETSRAHHPEGDDTRSEVRPGGEGGISPAEAAEYYKRLEQTGELIDVTTNTDLSQLPPRVTHVRYPDGRIERVGFAESMF